MALEEQVTNEKGAAIKPEFNHPMTH